MQNLEETRSNGFGEGAFTRGSSTAYSSEHFKHMTPLQLQTHWARPQLQNGTPGFIGYPGVKSSTTTQVLLTHSQLEAEQVPKKTWLIIIYVLKTRDTLAFFRLATETG